MGDYRGKTELNRKILDHLLHDAFSDDRQTQAEVDLVLDPDPPEERIDEVLGKYRFRDVKQAYRNLMSLAEERIRFLSTRRCRHFLAAIAPQLLAAIAETADPDSTLVNLDKVSDSLGGKGVLWELFSFNPPSLRLYVELCAYSPYLSGILTSNPGMIDGLMDSLVLDKLPTRENMEQKLAELCRAAEDIDPILQSFKNDQQLCVGVRDILGKEDVQATTGALSDIAETCLAQIAAREYATAGGPLRPAAHARARKAVRGRPALRNGHPGPGQVRRPGDELPQRPRRDLPLRGRRPDHGRRRNRPPRQSHHEPTFFQRTGPADHPDRQPARAATAGCTRSMPGCVPPAEAARWRPVSTSSRGTSPAAAGSFGNGRRCARRGWCTARRGRPRPRWPPWPRPPSPTAGGAKTPRKSAACGSGWKTPPRPPAI